MIIAGGNSARAERIMRAARDMFFRHGYHGATTDMIQAAAGVSKATLYRYFPSKEQLFRASLEAHSRDFLASIGRIATQNEDPRTFLLEFGVEFLQALVSSGGLRTFRLMMAEGERFPDVGKLFYSVGPTATVELVASYLAQAHARGALRVANPPAAAVHFISMVRGEIVLRCLLGAAAPPSRAEIDTYIGGVVDTFLAAHGGPTDR
jgi:TetR/AcrR family transcriptional repressor of mexJK operon